MQARVVWSGLGRCAVFSTAMSMLVFAGGCSSGSRFDFPAFNLTGSSEADPQTTASVPLPEESVYDGGPQTRRYGQASQYGQGGQYSQAGQYGQGGQYSRAPLPPPQGYSTDVVPATYSPQDHDMKPQQATYTPPRATPMSPRPGAGSQTIRVSEGDSLYGLARRYGVSVRELKDANGLDEARIRIGQKLTIPGSGRAAPAPRAVAAKAPAKRTVVAANEPREPATASDVAPLRSAAGSSPALPSETPAESAGAEKAAASAAHETDAPAESQPAKDEPPAQIASTDRLPSPEPMSGNSFRWPVQGRIVSGFGAKPSGGNNDGIDIAVPLGTPVKAAENGVVAYSGDELKGYGNLVLVRHANNWVSAYAHNDEILVKRGEQVRRGQVIGKAGRTGQASQPQLHFELRKGSRPVDPTKYMTSAAATAD